MASEKKLISVDDLKAKIEITDTDVCADYGDGFCQHGYSNQLLRLMINELQTVDAVEVIRCENCEYFMEDIFKRTVCDRTFDMFVIKANDFYSYGKRKIGGEKEL